MIQVELCWSMRKGGGTEDVLLPAVPQIGALVESGDRHGQVASVKWVVADGSVSVRVSVN